MRKLSLISFLFLFTFQSVLAQSFFEKWKSKRQSRKVERNQNKIQKNYLDKTPEELAKKYCFCFLTSDKPSQEELDASGSCLKAVYEKANEAKEAGKYIKENDMFRKESEVGPICSSKQMKAWNKDFKGSEEDDDEKLADQNTTTDKSECSSLGSISERRACRLKANEKSAGNIQVTVGGDGKGIIVESLVTKDETSDDEISWDSLTKAERKKLSRNLVKYCTCESKKSDEEQMKCMDFVTANSKIPDQAFGKDVCSKDESKAYAKTLKKDDTNCDRLNTIPERRKCRLEASEGKKSDINVTAGSGGDASNVPSLVTNDETFTGEENYADLSKSERKKLEKILKKNCSCERLSDIEKQGDCVKFAMNLDKIPSEEYGKSVCSKEEVASYKKSKSKSSDDSLKACVLEMPAADECQKNFTAASKDYSTCVDKMTSCALSASSKDKCTEKRSSCETKARSKDKNGLCFQMIGLHDKEEDKPYNEKLKKMCDAGADIGDANKMNACYEQSLKESANKSEKFDQCLVDSGLNQKYKLGATNSICLQKAKSKPDVQNPIAKDSYFYGKYKDACSLDATPEDQDKIIGCYAEARTNASDAKNKFVACTDKLGLTAKYDLKSFKQSLKDEFKVAGCETFYDGVAKAPESQDAQQALQQCIIRRVGQEAAKAILAEFAKDGVYRLLKDECEKKWKGNEEKTKECLMKLKNTSNMIGAFSAMGMDTMSCIPPREIRANGDKPITDSAKFCAYLNADGGGTSQYATENAKNHCLAEVKICDREFKDKPDLFQACGMTVVECTKQWAKPGQSINYNADYCESKNIVKNLLSNDKPNPNPNFNTSMCIAGAVSSGLNAVTAAICANEKKYPTAEAKDACLKKLQFVNEIGTAGATVANCMKLGPVPMSEADELKLPPEEIGKRDALKAQRQSCLAKGLGSQAVDLITQQVCNAKKTQEEKETCFKRAGIVKVAGTSVMRIADCQKINKMPYSDAVGNERAASDYKACMQNAVLDSAFGILSSDLAADTACAKNKDDKDKFEQCKNKYKSAMKLTGVGISAAQRMAHCASIPDEKEKQSCLVTASLTAGGEILGPIGDLACAKYKDDPAKFEKCNKSYNAAGQIVNIAAATNVIIHDIERCKGDQACLAAVLAKQLPGDAGVYASFAVQGYGLIKQKNPCKTPSKYLYKAGALVKIAGDLTTHIVHKVQSDELKKKYADLVHDEKVQGGSDLYSNIKGFVDGQKKERDKEKAEETKQKFDSQEAANEAQLRGLAFQRKNEENTLQSSLWQRPFLYSSSTLNAAANTMAVFEAMAEAADGKPYQTASWYKCEKANKAPVTTDILKRQTLNIVSVSKAFEGLNNQQALALYEDYERFVDGNLKSISLDEYDSLGKLDFDSSEIPMAESLKIAANFTFNLVTPAEAVDLSVLENIGVNMVGGLFPGTGGFGQGSPVGYAQDIVYLFIHKGLDMACGPEKRNKETGHCEYTGKATIEFAAKKAAQALLKQNQEKLNKAMNTAEGRIVIGLWNLGKLVKLVVDNEKIIVQQRDRVNYMKSQEEGFKANSTGFNYKYKEKLRKFVDEYIFSEAHAKISDSPDNLKFCLNKEMNVDFKCSCRQNGCYRLFPSQDKNFQQNLGDMSKKFGNTFGQGLNAGNSVANMMDQVFAGMRGTDDISAEQMDATAKKLQKFNTSLVGAYNKMRVNAKLAPLDFDKYVAAHDKKMFASLHPDVQRSLANVKLSSLAPNVSVKGKTAAEIEAEKKIAVTPSTGETPDEPVMAMEDEKVDTETQVARADTQMNEAMTRTYQYDKNDINLDKELSLFKVISGRYIKKKDKLQKHD